MLIDEVKQTITVVKIGMTRDFIIPEEICEQEEISKTQIPGFYRNKRVIGLSNILSELLNNYSNQKLIWICTSRNQTLVYSTCKEVRDQDMKELRKWGLTQQPLTRSIKKGIIFEEAMEQFCEKKLAKNTMITYVADVVADTTLFQM